MNDTVHRMYSGIINLILKDTIERKKKKSSWILDRPYNEWDFENNYYESLSDEKKKELGETAQKLFNSDKSPLAFMVESCGGVRFED